MEKVYVARYEHKYGVDVRVFKTEESANAWRLFIADEWWGNELRKDRLKPVDPEVAAEEYWDYVSGREFFEIEETTVEE